MNDVQTSSIEQWPLARVRPFPGNAKKHSAAQVEQLAASILEWGFTIPILVDEDGVVIAGHGRLAAASLIHAAEVARSLILAGFEIRSQIIWAKQHFVLSRGDYHWQHEPCWYAVRAGGRSHWAAGRDQKTVWQIDNNSPFGSQAEEATGHGTQKPVECMARPIRNNTVAGDGVYDPFVGSGTTLIAAEMSGRRGFAIDIDPRYVDVVVQRWQKFTGKPATLDGDGRAFASVAGERRAAAPAPTPRAAAPAPARRQRKRA
jgi:DNA methylase/ParB/Sulfiredoxin domain